MVFRDFETTRWDGGQLLAFSALDGRTDYRDGLTGRTMFGETGIDIKLPAGCRVRFPGAAGGAHVVSGDWFRLGTGVGAVRGTFLDAYHLLIEGTCEVRDGAPGIAMVSRENRTLLGAASHFDVEKLDCDPAGAIKERKRWLEGVKIPSGLSDVRRRALRKALSIMKTQVYTPEGPIRHRWTTPDRWPHRAMWLWDSVFHAIGWRHIDPALAREMLSAVLDMQGEDGFVPHMMSPIGRSAITQPPVLALGVRLVNEVEPDAGWVRELYPKLCAYLEWDLAHRDSDGAGLAEWAIEGDPMCRSGESGMDNSPRFDSATQLDAVDFNAFLALECETLAGFAGALGLAEDAAKWEARGKALCRLIGSRLWSEDLGFFVDYDVEKDAASSVLASSGFLPLICGAATAAQASRLVKHLDDPAMFATAFRVPSIAARDTAHYSKDMWRGPVWINVNWLIARGLDRYGYDEMAARLRAETVDVVEKYHASHGTFFEFYDDREEAAPPELLRKGKCAPDENPIHQALHDYGWTATLYADLVYAEKKTVSD